MNVGYIADLHLDAANQNTNCIVHTDTNKTAELLIYSEQGKHTCNDM